MRFSIFNRTLNSKLVNNLRKCSSKKSSEKSPSKNIRNIGIIAHIDAGKTTTTERMLYYSGTIGSMGEVHHGNTVTDWMDQERKRGITITSAAVSFLWGGNQFNLIDTPGHIDFTMEVEQTLNVLDGGVVILDGSAGVEAQTLTVWRQSSLYRIPRIIFANKMDRFDSDLNMCLDSIKTKLEITPLCLQMPFKKDGKLVGVIDILTLEKVIWDQDTRGKKITRLKIDSKEDTELFDDIYTKRIKLVDTVSEHDDILAENIIQSGSLEKITTSALVESIRKATLKNKLVPVLCGSSYKNIGVQPLMDAIVLYLPSPIDKNSQFKCFESNLSARAFKVRHHEHRGPLVYFRIYSGVLNKGQKVYNIQREKSEQCGKLLIANADEFAEVDKVENGNIAVVSGLKETITGDLITSSATAAYNAKKNLENYLKKTNKKDKEIIVEDIFGAGAHIPEPVFFCSIEPPSLAQASALEKALSELTREDPSLRVSQNLETGQTVLSGMGELHIEIIKERIRSEYKIDVDIGPLQIAYKEMPQNTVKHTHTVSHKIGNSKHHVTITMSLVPTEIKDSGADNLILDKSQDSASNLANIFPKHLLAVKTGVDSALMHGPKLGCPVIGAQIVLHWLEIGRGTSETIIAGATVACIQKLLSQAEVTLLEPIMAVEVVISPEYVSKILADISRRRATIQQVTTRGNNKVVQALAPLSELLGYSTALRSLSSGTATFIIQFHAYQSMSDIEEAKAIQNVTGF